MNRHLLTLCGGLAGILLTIVLLITGASAIQRRQSAETPDFALETPDMADVPGLGDGSDSADTETGGSADPALTETPDAGLPAKLERPDKAVRDIAPEQFGYPEEVTAQPLERIEARKPLSQPVARPEPVPAVLRHPVALSAGLIQFGDRLLQLDGIEPQKADRVCGEQGKTWPCGMVAKTAFRNFLRARALVCTVPKNGWQGTLTAACSVNATDPTAWLAENGWADAPEKSPLSSKVAAARQSRLGFFGDDPRDLSPAPTVPDETLPSTDAGVDMTGR
ncbi:thermonuclease family protein [Rhizobium sp. Root483D2]|uniref:thermonuclease family protein n=1 Tax=Rhizobium sp. Root483D2 TaxID=1736545 RepID=UPI0007159518|nr:thermonuclease family protein [Rhizobium sp. Root483D2]KQY49038.1 hypothetical protein ASD32_01745 [Rhizobium sp. Root483D2]